MDDSSSWTPRMVLWNTLGTLAGALTGIVALVVALVALIQ
jgi:hypothetical protein